MMFDICFKYSGRGGVAGRWVEIENKQDWPEQMLTEVDWWTHENLYYSAVYFCVGLASFHNNLFLKKHEVEQF